MDCTILKERERERDRDRSGGGDIILFCWHGFTYTTTVVP